MLTRVSHPALSANEAKARSLIARQVLNRPLPGLSADGHAAELSLRPLARGVAPSLFSDPYWLEFEWAGARLVIEIPATAIDTWPVSYTHLTLPTIYSV